ncbi:hypothetical protein BM1_06669 [Bipolaris maydis]|nr:hypothetical protein BM1_06669 [Bipolaris maydis]
MGRQAQQPRAANACVKHQPCVFPSHPQQQGSSALLTLETKQLTPLKEKATTAGSKLQQKTKPLHSDMT